MAKRIGIIGATGSIGLQAVDVVLRNKECFEVVFLTAHKKEKELSELACKVNAEFTLLTKNGMEELNKIAAEVNVDLVLVGSTGTAVLAPVYEFAKRGVDLAIANKECLVAAGKLIKSAAKSSGASIIPVDSEHSAIFQCIVGHNRSDLAQIILTASGGALRELPIEKLKYVKPEDALMHPNWDMGKKITIDSATMMNKGLELIEARMLFDIPYDQLAVVIHPESIVHSMVSYVDGSVIAQMGLPDMRIPISYALNYPNRLDSGVEPLNFSKLKQLNFSMPQMERYPCLQIALEVLKGDKSEDMIAMNAANEIAVEAFLKNKLGFLEIPTLIKTVLEKKTFVEPNSVEDILYIDNCARKYSTEFLANMR